MPIWIPDDSSAEMILPAAGSSFRIHARKMLFAEGFDEGMGMFVVQHLLFLAARTTAFLTAHFFPDLPRLRFALVLTLENRLREHPPRKPPVVLPATRLSHAHGYAGRLM